MCEGGRVRERAVGNKTKAHGMQGQIQDMYRHFRNDDLRFQILCSNDMSNGSNSNERAMVYVPVSTVQIFICIILILATVNKLYVPHKLSKYKESGRPH